MTGPVVTKAPAEIRRFTDIDFLMLSVWGALVVLFFAIKMTPFFHWAIFGSTVLVARNVWSLIRGRPVNHGDLCLAALMPIFTVVDGIALAWVTAFTPRTYDALLAQWDFGVEAAVRAWAINNHLMPFIQAIYDSLPMVVLMVICLTSGITRSRLLWSCFLGAVLCIPCYLLFPAVGPIHAGDPRAGRNCMPSMHLTWAMLLWVNSKGWLRWITGAYVLLTVLSTLATGEHYVLDLVAAIPWTWFLSVLARKWSLLPSAHGFGLAPQE
jgi:hypothetical protein